jgi:outer membrane lipoprotein-sorting protein
MIRLRNRVLICFLLGLGACTLDRTWRAPVTPPSANTSPEILLASLAQRWQGVEALRALARVSVTSAQGHYSTRQTFLWRRPAFLRLDTLSFFGQPMMSLVANRAQTSIYYPVEGTFFQGPTSPATLARVIGLPLDVGEVAPLLLGDTRPSPTQPVAATYLQTDEAMYLLRFVGVGGGLIQDAWVDPDQLLPRRAVRYTQHGTTAVDIAYSDFRRLAGSLSVPHALAIWLPHTETEVRVHFLMVDINPGLSPAVFQLSPPTGVQISPLP